MTGLAGVMSLLVLSAEVSLPDRYKPSTVIGSFHGRVEAADAEAKREAIVKLARKNAEASSQPPAFAGIGNGRVSAAAAGSRRLVGDPKRCC